MSLLSLSLLTGLLFLSLFFLLPFTLWPLMQLFFSLFNQTHLEECDFLQPFQRGTKLNTGKETKVETNAISRATRKNTVHCVDALLIAMTTQQSQWLTHAVWTIWQVTWVVTNYFSWTAESSWIQSTVSWMSEWKCIWKVTRYFVAKRKRSHSYFLI